MADTLNLNSDEERLAELGYKQELNRSWSGFSNFAISFSIISILAGCFTTFGVGWNNGGPAAIAWGWPIIALFILVIGLCMSELVSAFPTSGGIYWWACKLGGPKAGYYTGWLNLIGLFAIDASVAYGCATFFDLTLDTYSKSWAAGYSLKRVFLIFLVVLVLAALVNIFSSHLLAVLNNISVWWHVAGAAAVVLILVLVPESSRLAVVGLHAHRQQHRILRRAHRGRGLLVRRDPAVVHPHPVHDHRLRRVRTPVRGDEKRCQLGGQGHLAVDLLLRHRGLDPAALVPVRREERGRRDGGRRRLHRRQCRDHLQPGVVGELGELRADDLDDRAVLLHRRLHDEYVADAVRVQPGRRGSRRQVVVEAECATASRSTGSCCRSSWRS